MTEESADDRQRRLVRDSIGTWRDKLVNLSRSNRLLSFRASRTGAVPIVDPGPSEVIAGLAARATFAFQGPTVDMSKEPEPAQAGRGRRRLVVLHTTTAEKDLSAALRNLLRRSQQEYLDRGLRALYVAIGTLEWTDETGAAYSSPLILVPVELQSAGPRQIPNLVAAEDDPVMNPALALKLAQSDIALPAVPDLDEIDPVRVLDQVRAAVSDRRGWRVTDSAVLSYFTFAKEAMYRDLLDNEDRIAAHPAIVALAAGGRGDDAVDDFGFDAIPDSDVDERAPVDRSPLVLDADSSQRACIAAAVDGRSFVMDGPPGTGKSQTIANMIGALLHAGRTVLFVSEKAAALDVVRNRLADVGLDAYLLELHSSKATRKEVATELGRSLSHQPVARTAMSAVDREQLRRRQDELNRYAAAMNEPREPLGQSLHAVIGQLAKLADVAAAPRTGRPVTDLDPALFGDIRRLARDLSRAWRPAVEGSSYAWRDVRQGHAMTARLQAARRALDALDELLRAQQQVAEAFALTGLDHAEHLTGLLEHAEAQPPGVPTRWITADPGSTIDAAVARISDQVEALRERRQQVEQATRIPWTQMPVADPPAGLDLQRIAGLEPAPMAIDRMSGPDIDGALHRLRSDAEGLRTFRSAIEDVAGLLRLPVPRTFDEADRLLFVASTAEAADRPEAAWLSPHGFRSARAAIDHLTATRATLDAAEASARRFYGDGALQSDATGLHERFRDQHTGIRKLGGAYRQDKATVAGFTRDGVAQADAHQHLALIVEWQHAAQALGAGAPAYARDLGRWFGGRATDRGRVVRALDRAAAIAARYPDSDLNGVAAQVAGDVRPAPALVHATRSAAGVMAGMRSALQQTAEFGPRPQLLTGGIAEATTWLDEHITVLTAARPVVGRLDAATGRTWSVGDTRHVLHLRNEADGAAAALAADGIRHTEMCGSLFDGDSTDLDALRAAAAWVRELHRFAGGVPTADQAATLGAGTGATSLRGAVSAWRAGCADVVDAFDPVRHAELMEDLSELDDARDLLGALERDADGQDEWLAYRRATDELRRLGLGEAVDFCAREHVAAGEVPAVIEKAVLSEWVDRLLSTDTALQPARARDRDSAVLEFRELDRQVVATAVGSIVEACNQRRPRSVVGGQAGVIRREAEKKRKHMPVRELVLRSRDVCQVIKPCFMMSPLAVSQYLPPDLTFDVVIFDEASQVAPMDAINCIYRGRAMITAGDAKQLPPTSFFALAGDDGDEWDDGSDDAQDFESILDLAKSSGAFRSLTLKWHYRSRHESLIAYSNSSFYGGELITFPGADHEGPDVGVELLPVQGVYRRGSSRDNLIEARKVAERVVHHYDTRPEMSVGVVTFSESQAALIEAMVDEARQERPDLDDHFTESRLNGFFVKSLESVQGDERDVMIFSIGYGPDENGKITASFGPLNRSGGWRRLNVAITRARYRNEIVSSLGAEQVPGATTNEGVRHLRRYLDFAARGLPALALDAGSGGDAESPFEESVIAAIRSWGYDVTPQVGAAGYRIDMAVQHPDKPGVHVLGVECDGAQYHSSRVARDRDRLREQVLTGLGWTMHRIWGTAWYRDRHGAERRLIDAIESAIAAPVRGLLGGPVATSVPKISSVELEEIEFSEIPPWTEPYVMATIEGRPRWCEPHEAAAEPAMRRAVQEIVDVEGPVHIDVVRQRLRDAWNIGQIGSRIRARLDSAVRASGVHRDGDFLFTLDRLDPRVRTPVEGCRRAVQEIPGAELELALVNLVRDARRISQDDATVHVARLYGWNRRGPDITRRFATIIAQLVADGRLARAADGLAVPG